MEKQGHKTQNGRKCVLCKYDSKLDSTQALNCAQDERLQESQKSEATVLS